jgi:hypothetical protein
LGLTDLLREGEALVERVEAADVGRVFALARAVASVADDARDWRERHWTRDARLLLLAHFFSLQKPKNGGHERVSPQEKPDRVDLEAAVLRGACIASVCALVLRSFFPPRIVLYNYQFI